MRTLRRIMLVEDDPDIRIVARLALADLAGFELEVCGSGREALDRAAQFAPDLILLDVMMPELDGPSTLRELRRVQSLEATPVIFMTARAQPEEVAEYRRLGALDVIVKPFDPMALGDQIRGIWSAQEAM
ncbi:MAG TPA: response regulator [Thermoanaerobaculia bacterium]